MSDVLRTTNDMYQSTTYIPKPIPVNYLPDADRSVHHHDESSNLMRNSMTTTNAHVAFDGASQHQSRRHQGHLYSPPTDHLCNASTEPFPVQADPQLQTPSYQQSHSCHAPVEPMNYSYQNPSIRPTQEKSRLCAVLSMILKGPSRQCILLLIMLGAIGGSLAIYFADAKPPTDEILPEAPPLPPPPHGPRHQKNGRLNSRNTNGIGVASVGAKILSLPSEKGGHMVRENDVTWSPSDLTPITSTSTQESQLPLSSPFEQCEHNVSSVQDLKELGTMCDSVVIEKLEDYDFKIFSRLSIPNAELVRNLKIVGVVSPHWFQNLLKQFRRVRHLWVNLEKVCEGMSNMDPFSLTPTPGNFKPGGTTVPDRPAMVLADIENLYIENSNNCVCEMGLMSTILRWQMPKIRTLRMHRCSLTFEAFGPIHDLMVRQNETLSVVSLTKSFLCDDCRYTDVSFGGLEKFELLDGLKEPFSCSNEGAVHGG